MFAGIQLWNLMRVMADQPAAPGSSDDGWLVRQARQSPQEFALLYDRHMTSVYRYLLARVGDVHDAEDLTSQTFLEAFEHLDSYRGTGAFRAWLLRIARNKVIDHYRRRRPQVSLSEETEWIVDAGEASSESMEAIVEHSVQMAQVARKLRTLSPDRAEAVALRIFGGLEVTEVAQTLGKPEPAVRMLLHRGVRDLQAQLNIAAQE